MRRWLVVGLAGALITGRAATAYAQSDSLKAGTWAVEASSDFGAALLRFSSPATAWRIAVRAAYAHVDAQQTGTTFPQAENSDVFNVDLRVGVRGYRGRGERYKPFTTVSLLAGYGNGSAKRWSGGAAAELGAAYFFSPHLSVGGAGEFIAAYERDEFEFGGGGTLTRRVTTLTFTGFRMLATILF